MNWARRVVILYITVCVSRHVSSQRPMPIPQSRTFDTNVPIAPNVNGQHVHQVPNRYPPNLHVPLQHNVQLPNQNLPVTNAQQVHIQGPAISQLVQPQIPNQQQGVLPQQSFIDNFQRQLNLGHYGQVPNQNDGNDFFARLLGVPRKIMGNIQEMKQIRHNKREVRSSNNWQYVSEALNVIEDKVFNMDPEIRQYYAVIIDAISHLSSEIYWHGSQNCDDQTDVYGKVYQDIVQNTIEHSTFYDTGYNNMRMKNYLQNYIQLTNLLTYYDGSSRHVEYLRSQLIRISQDILDISAEIEDSIRNRVPLTNLLQNPNILKDISLVIVDLVRDIKIFYTQKNLSHQDQLILEILFEFVTDIFGSQMFTTNKMMPDIDDCTQRADNFISQNRFENIDAIKVHGSKFMKRSAVEPLTDWHYVSEAADLIRNKLLYAPNEGSHYYVVVIDAILRLTSKVYWHSSQDYADSTEYYHKIYQDTVKNTVVDSMFYESDYKNSRMEYYYQNYVQLLKLLTAYNGNDPEVMVHVNYFKSQLIRISMLVLEISSKIDEAISNKGTLLYMLENPNTLQDITMVLVDMAKDLKELYIQKGNLSYEEQQILEIMVKMATAIFKPQMDNSYNRILSLVDNNKMVDHLFYHSLKHKNHQEGFVTRIDQNNKYSDPGTIIVYVLDKDKASQFNNIPNSDNKNIINENLLKQYLNNPNYRRVILIKDKTEANVITSPSKEWFDDLQGRKVQINDVYSINCNVKPIPTATTTERYKDDIDIKICAHFKKSNVNNPFAIDDIQNQNCNHSWPYTNSGTSWTIQITESPNKPSCQPIWVNGRIFYEGCQPRERTPETNTENKSLYDTTTAASPRTINWTESPWNKKETYIFPTSRPNNWNIQWSAGTRSTSDYSWIFNNPTTQMPSHNSWDYITRIPNSPRPEEWTTTDRPIEIEWKITSTPSPFPINLDNTESPRTIKWFTNYPKQNTKWNIKWQDITPSANYNYNFSSTESPFSFKWEDETSVSYWPIKFNKTYPVTESSWTTKWGSSPPAWDTNPWTSDTETSRPSSVKWNYVRPWNIKWTDAQLIPKSTLPPVQPIRWITRATLPPARSVKWIDLGPVTEASWSPRRPITWTDFKSISRVTLPSAQPIRWIDYKPRSKSTLPPARSTKWIQFDPITEVPWSPSIKWTDYNPRTRSPPINRWQYITTRTEAPCTINWIEQEQTTEVAWQPKWNYATTPWQMNWPTRKPKTDSSWSVNWYDYAFSTESSRSHIYPTTERYIDNRAETELPWDMFWSQDFPKQSSPRPIQWNTDLPADINHGCRPVCPSGNGDLSYTEEPINIGFGNTIWIGQINAIPHDFNVNGDSLEKLLQLNCDNYNNYVTPISKNYNFNTNRENVSGYIIIFKNRVFYILRNNNRDNLYNTDSGYSIKDITCNVNIPSCVKFDELYLQDVTVESNAANFFEPIINQINVNYMSDGNSCRQKTEEQDWVERDLNPILQHSYRVQKILYPNSQKKPAVGWEYVPNMNNDHPFSLDSCYKSSCFKNFMYCTNGTCFWNLMKCTLGNCDYGVVRCVGETCYKSKKQCNVHDCMKIFQKNDEKCPDHRIGNSQVGVRHAYPSRKIRVTKGQHCVGRFCFAQNETKQHVFHSK